MNSYSFNRLSNRVVQPVWQPAVYTIQPFVKPVVKRVWQPVECLYTRYNRLLNQFDNRFDKGLITSCIVYTNIYPVVKPTGLTKPVRQPVWQKIISCKRGLTDLDKILQAHVGWTQISCLKILDERGSKWRRKLDRSAWNSSKNVNRCPLLNLNTRILKIFP